MDWRWPTGYFIYEIRKDSQNKLLEFFYGFNWLTRTDSV